MSIVIGTLRIDLEAGTASFSEAMDKMQNLSAKTANDVKRSLEKIAAAGVLVGSAIVGGTEEMVRRSMEAIVGLEHMSQAAGTTIDQLSALNFAAQRVGVPTELLVKGMEKLANSAFKAQNGNAALANIFARLGIHTTDSQGHLQDTGLMIDQVALKFAGMADGAGKTALAIQLFGRGGAFMIPFLNEWGTHMDELREKAKQFGMVIGPEVAERTIKFHEVLNELKMAWTGFGMQLTAAALPALTAFATKLEQIAVKANIPKLAETFGTKLADALTTLGRLLDFATQHAQALKLVLEGLIAMKVANFAIPLIGQIAKGGIGNIAGGIEKLSVGLLGLKNVLPLLGGMVGWLRAAIPLLFEAGGASYIFGGALNFVAAHPVGLVITGLAALGAAMYGFRNSTFEAAGQLYKYLDAYTLLERVVIQRRLRTGSIGGDLALIKKEREASERASGSIGPELGLHNTPKNLFQPDTSGLKPVKKDIFGDEIAKLGIEIAMTAKYISVIGQEPDKIMAVVAAQKAQAEILKINQQLREQHKADPRSPAKLTEQQTAELKATFAMQAHLDALKAYGEELDKQLKSGDLTTQQTLRMAQANLEGDAAVRQASIDNAILALKFNKVGLELKALTAMEPALRKMLTAKSNADVIDATNKEIFGLQQEVAMRKITLESATQYTDAVREAALNVKVYSINQLIATTTDAAAAEQLKKKRDLIVEFTKLEFAEADAKEALALRSPLEQYQAEIDALEHGRAAMEKGQGQSLSYSQSLALAAKAQDAFNKQTDETVRLLLQFGTLRDGVKAFFLDMQKSAQTSASIIYEALHSAFQKLSDNLTELFTGEKTNFAKMFQDVGKQMLNQTIKSGLQTGLGAIGKTFGINLGGALKRDGSDEQHALWVQMAGAAGLALPGFGGAGGSTTSLGDFGFGFPGGGADTTGGGWLSKIAGLFSRGGGGGGNGMGSMISSLVGMIPGFAEGGTPSPGSAYITGENGPELRFASGEIASNSASERMMSQPTQVHNYTIDARGTDPVMTEQRVRAAIIASHNSAVSNSLQVSQEHLKRTPQKR